MLSKELFDEFLAPYYKLVVPALRDRGIYVIVDSDGDVTEMVPWLAEVGVHGILPLERQAGVDAARIRALRSDFRLVGHFDKMTMNRGEAGMRAEFERLLPLMRSGGFIPSVDHQTPPHVSLEEYRLYRRLLDEYTAAV
jgi:uroporphyrinogen-III decarboxylase